jgi:WD40 repeat protein
MRIQLHLKENRLAAQLSHSRIKEAVAILTQKMDEPQGLEQVQSTSIEDVPPDDTDTANILKTLGISKELSRVANLEKETFLDDERQKVIIESLTHKLSLLGGLLHGSCAGAFQCGIEWLEGRSYGITKVSDVGLGPIAKPSNTMASSSARIRRSVLTNYKLLWTVSGHMLNPAYCTLIDGSGRYAITGADDYLVKVWDIDRGMLVLTCRGHTGYISLITISPDNSLVASACVFGTIRIWRLRDGRCIKVLKHGDKPVNWIAFDKSNCALASVGDDGQCIVWDLSKMFDADFSESPMLGFLTSDLTSVGKDTLTHPIGEFSREGVPQYFSSSHVDAAHPQHELVDAPAPAGSGGGSLCGLFNWSRGVVTSNLLLPHIEDCSRGAVLGTGAAKNIKVHCLDVWPGGGVLATGCEDGIVRLWRYSDPVNIDSSDPRREASRGVYRNGDRTPDILALKGVLTPTELSRMETVVNHLLPRLEGHVSGVTDVRFSNLGDRLVSGSLLDGTVRIWSFSKDFTKSDHIVLVMAEDDEEASTMTFAGRGRRGANRKKTKAQVYNVCWTMDDLRVVTLQSVQTSASDGVSASPTRLKMWDSMTGDLLRVIATASSTTAKTLFPHPTDPAIILTAGEDGFLNLWDVDNEERVSSHFFSNHVNGGPANILDASFSPDGSRISTTDDLGRLSVIGLDDPDRYERIRSVFNEQYFSTDYADIML